MKRTLFLLLLTTLTLHADELTKNVQSELKELGFYYGEATGVNSPETAAAVKRYQIRNGFEVTGTFTKETLQGLGLVEGPAPAQPAPTAKVNPAPAARPPSPPPTPPQPTHLRRSDTARENDRSFLEEEPTRPRSFNDPAEVAPPAPLIPPSAPGTEGYAHIFARTPYEVAPAEVQAKTLRKAQSLLAQGGHFRDTIDGQPGPVTEEAILSYQRRTRLPLTGRLDLSTLSAMSLLPGRKNGPPMKPFTVPPGSRGSSKVYRGQWVD